MEAMDGGLQIYYTSDGSDPTKSSEPYNGGIKLKEKGLVKAIAFDPESGLSSEMTTLNFDICKELWQVILPDPRKDYKAAAMIDSNDGTIWRSSRETSLPQEVVVDLGEIVLLEGFTYLPTQQRYIDGTISFYRFYLSLDGKQWGEPVSQGEFSNIKNSPVLQRKMFEATSGRYFKFVADREINNRGFVSIAELGIITKEI